MMSRHNCSLYEEYDRLSKFQTRYLSEAVLLKLCEFIFISCVVIVLHLLISVICSKHKLKKLKLSEMKLKSKTIVHIILISLLIFTLPFITMLIAGALLYKVLCSVAIKRKDKRYVKFLDSFDVFYYLEDKNTTDIHGTVQSNTIELAVDNIKEKLRNVFTKYGTDKMFYRKNEEYGFYYWRRYSFIDLAQYVQVEEVPETVDKNTRQTLSKLENTDQIVSYNDEGLFKVLIMKNHREGKANDEYRITLKFHHSVKDVALLEFVARLVEKSDDCKVTLHYISSLEDRASPDAIINMITKLYDILARSLEGNNLYENQQYNTINMMKALNWTKSDENLLCKVKNVCDLNITDVIGYVLSRILNKLERGKTGCEGRLRR